MKNSITVMHLLLTQV